MRGFVRGDSPFWIVVLLLSLMATGLSILIWLAAIPASEITPGQQNLMNIGDWIVKASLGAIFGFAGARLSIANRDQPPPPS